jgi:hypothetical protein
MNKNDKENRYDNHQDTSEIDRDDVINSKTLDLENDFFQDQDG